jgi:hypothetical protein
MQIESTAVIDSVAQSQRFAIKGAKQAGFTLTNETGAGPGPPHAYLSTDGAAVVFFTLSSTEVLTAARHGICLVQDQRFHLPPEVPPGRYSRVDNKAVAMMVAFDPGAKKGKARVLGIAAESYDFVVQPAADSCVEPSSPGTL